MDSKIFDGHLPLVPFGISPRDGSTPDPDPDVLLVAEDSPDLLVMPAGPGAAVPLVNLQLVQLAHFVAVAGSHPLGKISCHHAGGSQRCFAPLHGHAGTARPRHRHPDH